MAPPPASGSAPGQISLTAWPTRLAVRARAVPIWVWLTGLVVASSAVRFAIGKLYPTPWIPTDEFVYAELARSLAFDGTFELRGVSVSGYSTLYPVLIAPVYGLFANQVDAYTAVKAINAVVISLTAVPTYLLARRLVGPGLAFLASVLALAIVAMFYSAMVMTENLFYPLFMLIAYLLVLVLERPTIARQLILLGVLVLAVLTRLQAVALVPAVLTALLLRAALETRGAPAGCRLRTGGRTLAPFALTIILLCAAAAAVITFELVRRDGLEDLLGTYGIVSSTGYPARETAAYLVRHLVDLDLLTGVVPFAAFIVIGAGALRGKATNAEKAFVAGAFSLVFWLLLVVSLFSSALSTRIEERLIFYVAPLFFVALVTWIARRSPRGIGMVVAAGIAAALPALINLGGLISRDQLSDALSLLPLLTLLEEGVTASQISWIVLGSAGAAALAFLLAPASYRITIPMVLLVVFALQSLNIDARIRQDSEALSQAFSNERTWIDDAVGPNANVVSIWPSTPTWSEYGNEFFSRQLGGAYRLGDGNDDVFADTPASVEPDGQLIDDDTGERVLATDVVAIRNTFRPIGTRIAEDERLAVRVYRVDGPVRLKSSFIGLYTDRYAAPTMTYTHWSCRGGLLRTSLTASSTLMSRRQTVVATQDGREVGRAVVTPGTFDRPLIVPLIPHDGVCSVTFTTSPTFVPDDVAHNGDTRELGLLFGPFKLRLRR